MAGDSQFLGRGWSFPPVFDKVNGEIEMVEGEADIQSSLEIILSTELGERVLHPSFGWKRDKWIFESLTTTAATSIQSEIEMALLFFEPRINLNFVRLIPDENTSGRIEIQIDYTIRSTNTRGNLVYPFYLNEI
ncbi:GPW/gp25 family protein [Lunatibacter salilacus]|uniref:GPW/gp25 family protein n=1 Tax=Lunatibacter salilacus TaxID=2483804 RepID=UPI00131E9F46|nr:GPW/gp25 family protein [Lunatibacter salilacus]